MGETIGKEETLKIIRNVAKTVIGNEKKLTELDAKIGDGDHGVNLRKIFNSVLEKFPELKDEEDIGIILKKTGSTVMESTGGSVGVLYGSPIKEMGEEAEGKQKLELKDIVEMGKAADEAVKKRGRVEVGEKTMYDAIHPFVEELEKSYREGLSLEESLKRAEKSAKDGKEKTKNMVAKKGRGKYFGEKTIGHIDVGAMSSFLMIESVIETITSES